MHNDEQTYEIWWSEETDSTTCTSAQAFRDNPILLEPDAVLLKSFQACSWEEAMTQMHEFLGFEPYSPMTEDDNG